MATAVTEVRGAAVPTIMTVTELSRMLVRKRTALMKNTVALTKNATALTKSATALAKNMIVLTSSTIEVCAPGPFTGEHTYLLDSIFYTRMKISVMDMCLVPITILGDVLCSNPWQQGFRFLVGLYQVTNSPTDTACLGGIDIT